MVFLPVPCRGVSEPELLCPNCPVCGVPPRKRISPQQAICDNPSCRALFFDQTQTAAQQLANTHEVRLLRDDL